MVDDFDDVEVVAIEFEAHARDAPGGPTGRAEEILARLGVAFAETDGEALVRDEDEFVVAGREHGADDGVVLGEVDADETAFAGTVGVVGERALLNHAALGRHDEEAVRGEVLHADHRGDLFALGETEEGRDGFALRGARALRDIVNLLRMALADAREEQDVVVG